MGDRIVAEFDEHVLRTADGENLGILLQELEIFVGKMEVATQAEVQGRSNPLGQLRQYPLQMSPFI